MKLIQLLYMEVEGSKRGAKGLKCGANSVASTNQSGSVSVVTDECQYVTTYESALLS